MVVDQIRNAHHAKPVSIANVSMFVKQLNVASMQFVVLIIIIVHNANACQVIVAIHKLNVFDRNAQQTLNAHIIWRV